MRAGTGQGRRGYGNRRRAAVLGSLVALLALGAAAGAGPLNDVSLVKDINPGAPAGLPIELTKANGTLFFIANDGTNGFELWRSDGTLAGTSMVKNIDPSTSNAVPFFPSFLTDVNGTLFFVADDGASGRELWKSDGTAAGTVLVKDIKAVGGSSPYELTNVNGTLFFVADNGVTGAELWKSDGTTAGTTFVRDINPTPTGSSALDLTNVNGTLFFGADDGTNGRELWKSDGTVAGTTLVKDINPAGGGFPEGLADINGTLYFRADDSTTGFELWKSDGTAAGTTLVKEINSGAAGSSPQFLTDVNGILYFSASDGPTSGTELWKSDGTTAGTTLVKDINPTVGSFPESLTDVNGSLYFVADNGSNGEELWKSDGTTAGTALVKDINPGAAGSASPFIPINVNVNGTLYFSADDGANGYELWKSDGTAAGTVLAKDINPGVAGSSPSGLTNVNGTLYFDADDGTTGVELWRAADTIPPETTISSGPVEGSTITDPSPAFGFSSDDPPSSFECRYDADAFGPCSGPADTHTPTAALADGSHSFEVRAIDQAGNVDASPAKRSFSVDTRVAGAKLKAKPKQKQKTDFIQVKAKAGAAEPVTIAAKAKVKAKQAKGGGKRAGSAAKLKPLKLKAKPTQAAAGKLAKIKLKAKPAKSKGLLKALENGATAKAKLKVTLTDAAGHTVTLKKSVKLLAG